MAWTFMLQGDPQNQQAYRVLHDHTLTITATNSVLVNDMAFDSSQGYRYGSQLGAVLASGPSHASSFQFNSNGTFTYTAAAGFTGTDIFTYRATYTDQNNVTWTSTSTANAVITVYNTDPTAYGDSYNAWAGGVLIVDEQNGVLKNDGSADPTGQTYHRYDFDGDRILVSLTDVEAPQHGMLDMHSDGSFNYTGNEGDRQADSFRYKATDGVSKTQWVTVTIAKTGVILVYHDWEQDPFTGNYSQVDKVVNRDGVTLMDELPLQVGEVAKLEVKAEQGALTPDGSKATWEITGFSGVSTDTAIAGFQTKADPAVPGSDPQTIGEKILLTSTGLSKSIYWISTVGSNKNVNVRFSGDNAPPNLDTSFRISKPSETIIDVAEHSPPKLTGTGAASKLVVSHQDSDGAEGPDRFYELVEFARQNRGPQVTSTGTYKYVQIIESDATTIKVYDAGVLGGPVSTTVNRSLDNAYFYPKLEDLPSNDIGYRAVDSPSTNLIVGGKLVGWIDRTTEFTTYLQWQSKRPESIYAPLRQMSWGIDYHLRTGAGVSVPGRFWEITTTVNGNTAYTYFDGTGIHSYVEKPDGTKINLGAANYDAASPFGGSILTHEDESDSQDLTQWTRIVK